MVTRINGFSSGLDIDQLVRQLMTAQRLPMDKLVQKKQTLEWQREDFRTLNSQIMDFRNAAFDMRLSSSYLTRKASSSNENAVSATAAPGTVAGNYTVKVNALAKAASISSEGPVGATSTADTLSSIGMDSPGPTEVTITGKTGSVSLVFKTTDKISDVISRINAVSTTTGVVASYDTTLQRFFFKSSTTGADATVDIRSPDSDFLSDVLRLTPERTGNGGLVTGSVAFVSGTPASPSTTKKINDSLTSEQTLRITYKTKTYNFNITSSTSVGTLINRINASGLGKEGVSAYLDKDGHFTLFNPDSNEQLDIQDATSDGVDILSSLGLTAGSTAGTPITYHEYDGEGQNASVEFNGLTPAVEFSSNTFTINGITFTAKETTTSDVNIAVTQDVDAVFDKIKSFVEKYNSMLDAMNKELSEERFRDFQPLTDEQREAMNEDDIKKWEEKARSGLLRNDSILSGAVNSFRYGMVRSVTGLPAGHLQQMSEIGISTGAYAYNEKGKLYIDEELLREAISDRPEEVLALFTADDNDSTSSEGDGLARRLHSIADSTIDMILQRAGTSTSSLDNYTIGRELYNVNTRITSWERRLVDMENRYYKQFTAMEQALAKLQAQSTNLMSQFGGTGG